MARQCGLGPTRFIHYTRLLNNPSPITHLARCRLVDAARQRRTTPERSILEVAFSVGYSSSQYSATVSSDKYGCTPTEFAGRR